MAKAKMKASPAAQLEAPRFEEGKALLIAGLRKMYAPGEMNDIPAQWQRFVPHIGKIAGQVGRAAYGVCWQASDGEGIEYLSGVEVSGFLGVPNDFTVVSLPASKYAVFSHREHVMKLRETIDAIFREWLPESGHEATGEAETPAFLERYSEEFKREWAGWKFGSRSNRKRVREDIENREAPLRCGWPELACAIKCAFPRTGEKFLFAVCVRQTRGWRFGERAESLG